MYQFRKGKLGLLDPPGRKAAAEVDEKEAAGVLACPPAVGGTAVDELPELKAGRCIDCLNARAIRLRDGTDAEVRCLQGIGGTWRLWGGGCEIAPPVDAWHYCAAFVAAFTASGGRA